VLAEHLELGSQDRLTVDKGSESFHTVGYLGLKQPKLERAALVLNYFRKNK